jgi:hypothetical protein
MSDTRPPRLPVRNLSYLNLHDLLQMKYVRASDNSLGSREIGNRSADVVFAILFVLSESSEDRVTNNQMVLKKQMT